VIPDVQRLIDDELERPPRSLVGVFSDERASIVAANARRGVGRRVRTFVRELRAGGVRATVIVVVDVGPRRVAKRGMS
jgi:hypothetical protein